MRIDGEWLKEEDGRTALLRGVNLGANSKVPFKPDGASWRKEGFYDYRDVSFVGRPFPLSEADEHFRRLKEWGLTFERFLVTWEALEHAGPGIYDEAYLDYIRAVLEKAAEYGISVFIDPHQDVWSRWTGGDGAPAWTMELLGMDIRKMHEVGAAFVHCEHGDPIPHMIWDTNNNKFGVCTMFTLFFGGNDFAPRRAIDGVPVQEFLQGHFIEAYKRVARRLRGLPNVVGYGSMNEPQSGYIEMKDLSGIGEFRFLCEAAPSPLESMAAADGHSPTVDRYKMRVIGPRKIGRVALNPRGERLWKEGVACVWKEHGVWGDVDGAPRILMSDYFSRVRGRAVSFVDDYLRPFVNRFAGEIRGIDPKALFFVEAVPGGKSFPSMGPGDAGNLVNSSHWYDVLMNYRNAYNPWFTADAYAEGLDRKPWRALVVGKRNAARAIVRQIAYVKNFSRKNLRGAPTLIGEFGLLFKIYNGRAYRTGNYARHIQALDAYYGAMDANLVNNTIWCYTETNNNERGCNWNDEDNSLFSRDQQDDPSDINSGGRAIAGFCRPYARKTSGEPLSMAFDLKRRRFVYAFKPDPSIEAPTEIFVPRIQFPRGYAVSVSSGNYAKDEGDQILRLSGGTGAVVTVIVAAL
jgi:hypothetical protein